MNAVQYQNLSELSQAYGNEVCADCRRSDWDDLKVSKKDKGMFGKRKASVVTNEERKPVTTYVNKKLGVFLCPDCAEVHRNLPAEISDVDLVENCNNDVDVIKLCMNVGNKKAEEQYEARAPGFLIRPDPAATGHLARFREQFVRQKYEEQAFVAQSEELYNIHMPEVTFEMDSSMLKGKSSWSKVYLVHQHLWLMIFENALELGPLMKVELSAAKSCAPVAVPQKDGKPLFAFNVVYSVKKDGKEREKTVVFQAPTFEKMEEAVTSIRKAMLFYEDPANLPKLYKVPVVARIANLMIRNSVAKGFLEKRTSRSNWTKRYFAVVGPSLYYFKKEDDTKPHGMIPLHNTEIKRRVAIVGERKFSFALVCDGRTYFLAAAEAADMQDWVSKLRTLQHDYPVRSRFNFSDLPARGAGDET